MQRNDLFFELTQHLDSSLRLEANERLDWRQHPEGVSVGVGRRTLIVTALLIASLLAIGGVYYADSRGGGDSDLSGPTAELGIALQEDEIVNATSSADAYQLTLGYIAWMRGNAGALSTAARRQHLADLANTVADTCPLCADALTRELNR